MKIAVIADLHLGDANIIKYEGRPFRDVDDMNSTIMANWNSTADSSDTIFVLGDFISDISYFDILTKLNGKIKLIVGNHYPPILHRAIHL